MRVMASLGLCTTPAPEVYQGNDKTVALIHPIGRDGVPCMYVGPVVCGCSRRLVADFK